MSTHTLPHQTGVTPVFIAAQKNHVEALEMLIMANVDVNQAMQVRERSPKLPFEGKGEKRRRRRRERKKKGGGGWGD